MQGMKILPPDYSNVRLILSLLVLVRVVKPIQPSSLGTDKKGLLSLNKDDEL